jgi:hypothetical protein
MGGHQGRPEESIMFGKSAFALILVLGASSPGVGQEWAQRMFQTTSHNFGTVARSARADFEFVLTNLYMEDVHVADARASCSCTEVSIRNPWLKTYERGAIVANFNTRAFTGQRGATITVTIDRPYPATVQLQVGGYIRDDVVFEPSGVDLGTVERGNGVERTVTVNYTGQNSNWQVLGVRSPNPNITADVYQTYRYWGQASYTLRVRLNRDTPNGYIKDHLVLLTSDSSAPQIPLEIEGWVRPAVTVSPASLFIGELQPGQQVTRQLVVQAKTPFRVLSVTGSQNLKVSTAANVSQEARPVHVIPVTITTNAHSGKLEEKIHIETDLNQGAELSTFAFVKQ